MAASRAAVKVAAAVMVSAVKDRVVKERVVLMVSVVMAKAVVKVSVAKAVSALLHRHLDNSRPLTMPARQPVAASAASPTPERRMAIVQRALTPAFKG